MMNVPATDLDEMKRWNVVNDAVDYAPDSGEGQKKNSARLQTGAAVGGLECVHEPAFPGKFYAEGAVPARFLQK